MRVQFLSSMIVVLAGSSAFAAAQPDLSVSIAPPGVTPNVGASARYDVTVANGGNRDAAGVSLTIQLPRTGTSPQVYVMGTVGARDSRCAPGGAAGTLAGTRLVCNLGTVRKSQSTTAFVYLALPEKTGALVLDASATTTTQPEANPANNLASGVADLLYYPNAIATGATYQNQHCTGSASLSAYFECTLFSGSISSHRTIFQPGGSPGSGTITFPDEPGYGGTWSLSGVDLDFTYTDGSGTVATFSGRGVTGGCFEGLTTFPNSAYVSPYRVCLE